MGVKERLRIPAVGDTVVFVYADGDEHPATVTALGDPLTLSVLSPYTGLPYTQTATYDSDGAPGTWHWPD
jgi:plastocyanin